MLWAELMDGGLLPYGHLYMTPVQVALAVAEERLQPQIPENLPTDLQVRWFYISSWKDVFSLQAI